MNHSPAYPRSPPPLTMVSYAKGCLQLNTKVVSMDKIEEDDDDEGGEAALVPTGCFDGCPRVRLTLADGSELLAQAAVVATEAPAAAKLLGEEVALAGGASPSTGRSSTCLYYAIDGPAPVGVFSLSSSFVWNQLLFLLATRRLIGVLLDVGLRAGFNVLSTGGAI